MGSPAGLITSAVGWARTAPEILAASAQVSRLILGADSTFVAVADVTGAYPMSITDGIRDPRFTEIVVRPGAGLGGQVLLRGRPCGVADYAHDPTISRDFVHVVCEVEGLSGMACVPVHGPDRIEALLYTSTRATGLPGDQALRTLGLVAAYAELALHQAAARKQETELALLRDRQRLATQLHDSVAQMLFAIGVAAHYSRRQDDPAALAAALAEIEATAAQARSELRATLHRLSEPAEGLAFGARLAGELSLFERRTGCQVKTTERGERRELPLPVEELVIDTALEGLRNAVKYGAARAAVVHLAYEPGSVTLVVAAGSEEVQPLHPHGCTSTGAGLALLRQRAAQLRGSLELTSGPAGHTVLCLGLPARLTLEVSP
ncbi:MAG TPA: histidine kinase [Streptosporangiaceae bacterium]|nr:histidine kinase [Streptosporangiaceae bacterium]